MPGHPPAPLDYSVVIATMNRPFKLERILESLGCQSLPCAKIIIADSSDGDETRAICLRRAGRAPLHYLHLEYKSAALQRNEGAFHVETPFIAFIDDDLVLPSDIMEKLLRPFATDTEQAVGGVAGRIREIEHTKPGPMLKLYYRVQAGYDHPDYGGHVFGPGLNCLPCYESTSDTLVRAQWLNTGCVVYRTDLFRREQFPWFNSQSFQEDVHLSARIARTHRLYFHRDAVYSHDAEESPPSRRLAEMRFSNQRRIALEILGLHPWTLGWKLLLHRVFLSLTALRGHKAHKWKTLASFWFGKD
jgi:glycosyltransferase involved in cell wall biosynthesis